MCVSGRDHGPHDAQHHPEMAPVIDVDNESLAHSAKERGKDREISALPWHADEYQLESHDHGDEHQRGKADSCNPAA